MTQNPVYKRRYTRCQMRRSRFELALQGTWDNPIEFKNRQYFRLDDKLYMSKTTDVEVRKPDTEHAWFIREHGYTLQIVYDLEGLRTEKSFIAGDAEKGDPLFTCLTFDPAGRWIASDTDYKRLSDLMTASKNE